MSGGRRKGGKRADQKGSWAASAEASSATQVREDDLEPGYSGVDGELQLFVGGDIWEVEGMRPSLEYTKTPGILADALGCQWCHFARHWTPGEVQLGREIHGFEKNNLVPAKGKMLESRRPVEKILLKPRQDVPAV